MITEWFDKQQIYFDKYRFGIMIPLILLQSCVGSLAALMAIKFQLWSLVSLAAALSMASNAMFIAQAKASHCLITYYLSLGISTIVLFTLLLI